MLLQISDSGLQEANVISSVTEQRIAHVTEQASDSAAAVAVIDGERVMRPVFVLPLVLFAADGTDAALCFTKGMILLGQDAELFLSASVRYMFLNLARVFLFPSVVVGFRAWLAVKLKPVFLGLASRKFGYWLHLMTSNAVLEPFWRHRRFASLMPPDKSQRFSFDLIPLGAGDLAQAGLLSAAT